MTLHKTDLNQSHAFRGKGKCLQLFIMVCGHKLQDPDVEFYHICFSARSLTWDQNMKLIQSHMRS